MYVYKSRSNLKCTLKNLAMNYITKEKVLMIRWDCQGNSYQKVSDMMCVSVEMMPFDCHAS